MNQVDLQLTAVQADLTPPPARASQDPLYAGNEFVGIKGLDDVVLRILLQGEDLRLARIDGGQDDDRQVRDALDAPAELETVHPRHHHVDDHKSGPGAIER